MTDRERFDAWAKSRRMQFKGDADGILFLVWQAATQDALERAARWVCAYCADRDNWKPAKRGPYPDTYPEWWHLSARSHHVRNACLAWAIHHKLEEARALMKEGE